MTKTLTSQRIEWIDCAKGITILLVVLGHSVYGVLRGAIFSFHMPLFFIMSCLTYRLSTDLGQLARKAKKAFFRMVVPAWILFLIIVFGEALLERTTMDLAFWKSKGLAFLFSSGSQFYMGDPQIHVPRMGIPWFLIVLFTGRTLFDLLHLKLGKGFVPACLVLSILGVAMGPYLWLPFSFDVTLVSLGFLLFGYWLRKWNFEICPWICLICVAGVWAVSVVFTEQVAGKYLEMSMRRYPLFPLCIVTALAGTMMVSQFSSLLVRYISWVKKPLIFLGEHSMDMLCVHTVDFLWEPLYSFSSHLLIGALVRILIDLVVFMLFVLCKKLIKERKK